MNRTLKEILAHVGIFFFLAGAVCTGMVGWILVMRSGLL